VISLHLDIKLVATEHFTLYSVLLQFDNSWKSLQYMAENHKKFPNWCVYWIGPFIPWVYTANVNIMRTLLRQSGGNYLWLYINNILYNLEVLKQRTYSFLKKWTSKLPKILLMSGNEGLYIHATELHTCHSLLSKVKDIFYHCYNEMIDLS